MKKITLLFMFVAAAIVTVSAQDTTGRKMPRKMKMEKMMEKRSEKMAQKLSLTPEQKQQVDAIHETFKKDVQAFRENPEVKQARLKALKEAETKKNESLKKVLSPEQMNQYLQMSDTLKHKMMDKIKQRRGKDQ